MLEKINDDNNDKRKIKKLKREQSKEEIIDYTYIQEYSNLLKLLQSIVRRSVTITRKQLFYEIDFHDHHNFFWSDSMSVHIARLSTSLWYCILLKLRFPAKENDDTTGTRAGCELSKICDSLLETQGLGCLRRQVFPQLIYYHETIVVDTLSLYLGQPWQQSVNYDPSNRFIILSCSKSKPNILLCVVIIKVNIIKCWFKKYRKPWFLTFFCLYFQ